MLSEESFPQDFDKFDDAFIDSKNESRISHSSENVSEDFFMGNSVSMNSMISMDKLMTKPVPPPRGRKVSNDPHGNSFSSNDSSFNSSRFPPIPPRAPSKTKKYQSCQDLFLANNHPNLQRSKRYAHVESKVKKMINELRSEDRRRMITRHKSMPESTQNPSLIEESLEDMDDLLYQDGDINVLKSELQKKSKVINEMKEKSASDESKILMLEYDATKMKMSIDSMRLEFTQYVEKLRNSKEFSSSSTFSDISQYRSKRSIRDVGIQTDGFISPSNASTAILEADVSYLDVPKPTMHVRRNAIVETDQEGRVRINEFAGQRYENPLFRELTYNMTEEDINNLSIPPDSFNISMSNENMSSEHLISTIGNQHPSIPEGSSRPLKKKKKLKNRLLKFVPCVSRK